MRFLKKFDVISNNASLYGHGDNKKIQNFFGAVISLFCFILIGGASIFFIYDFLNNSKPNIIFSNSYADNYTVVDFHKIPYIFRLSDEFSIPDLNPSRLYRPRMLWVNTYLKDNKITQNYTFYETVNCDIDKHFDAKYREFIRNNVKDIGSYFCPDYPKDTQLNLTALYAGSKLYTYAFYAILQCNTTNTSNNCYAQDQIDNLFKNYFYDIIMLDYYIDQTHIPNQMSLYSTRGTINNKSKKVLKHKLKSVSYESDFGLVFESKVTVKFHQVMEYQLETIYDIPKQKFNDASTALLTDYVFNHNYLDQYSRSYMKAQELLANLGGIFKAIISIAQIVMFIFGQKISLLEVINSSYFISDFRIKSTLQNNFLVDKSNLPFTKNKESDLKRINDQNKKIKITDQVFNYLKERSNSKLELKFFEKYFFLFSYSNDSKIYDKLVKEMNKELNISKILINFQRYNSFLKDYFFKEEENTLFESLFCKGYINSKKLLDFEIILDNNKKKEYDEKLLNKLYSIVSKV